VTGRAGVLTVTDAPGTARAETGWADGGTTDQMRAKSERFENRQKVAA